MSPHIYVLILNWNGKDVLRPCLDSVLAIDYTNYTTLVIDNNSSDNIVYNNSKEEVKPMIVFRLTGIIIYFQLIVLA